MARSAAFLVSVGLASGLEHGNLRLAPGTEALCGLANMRHRQHLDTGHESSFSRVGGADHHLADPRTSGGRHAHQDTANGTQ